MVGREKEYTRGVFWMISHEDIEALAETKEQKEWWNIKNNKVYFILVIRKIKI